MRWLLFCLWMAIFSVANGVVASRHDDWCSFTRFLCPFAAGLWVAALADALIRYRFGDPEEKSANRY